MRNSRRGDPAVIGPFVHRVVLKVRSKITSQSLSLYSVKCKEQTLLFSSKLVMQNKMLGTTAACIRTLLLAFRRGEETKMHRSVLSIDF